MKSLVAILSAVILSACAGTTFHAVERDYAGNITRSTSSKKDVGLVYYQPVAHLLVQRPLNKDGAVTSKIIYLPDTENPMAMRFKSGFGKGSMSVTLENGMIKSFNQEIDTKIPETLSSLGGIATSLATADATRATGSLTRTEARQLSAAIEAAALNAGVISLDVHDISGKVTSNRCDTKDAIRLSDPANPNSKIPPADRAKIVAAANQFACAHDLLRDMGLPIKAQLAFSAAAQLMYVISANYENDPNKTWILFILGKNPIATPLRAAIGPLIDLKIGKGPDAVKADNQLKAGLDNVKQYVDRIDPKKKPTPTASPFELFRIDVTGYGTILTPVKKTKPIPSAPVTQPTKPVYGVCTPIASPNEPKCSCTFEVSYTKQDDASRPSQVAETASFSATLEDEFCTGPDDSAVSEN